MQKNVSALVTSIHFYRTKILLKSYTNRWKCERKMCNILFQFVVQVPITKKRKNIFYISFEHNGMYKNVVKKNQKSFKKVNWGDQKKSSIHSFVFVRHSIKRVFLTRFSSNFLFFFQIHDTFIKNVGFGYVTATGRQY